LEVEQKKKKKKGGGPHLKAGQTKKVRKRSNGEGPGCPSTKTVSTDDAGKIAKDQKSRQKGRWDEYKRDEVASKVGAQSYQKMERTRKQKCTETATELRSLKKKRSLEELEKK